jgi:hypothetical protein
LQIIWPELFVKSNWKTIMNLILIKGGYVIHCLRNLRT